MILSEETHCLRGGKIIRVRQGDISALACAEGVMGLTTPLPRWDFRVRSITPFSEH